MNDFTYEEQHRMFSSLVYCYNKFKKLPYESILWMKESDPEYAERLSHIYGDLLFILSRETMKAGLPDSDTNHPVPGHEKTSG